MRHVTRLPDRVEAYFVLISGGTLSDVARSRATIVKHERKVVSTEGKDLDVTVTRKGAIYTEKPGKPFGTIFADQAPPPDPAWPGATWDVYAIGVVRNFNTPTGNLEPGDVWTDGDRIAWRESSDTGNEARYQEADVSAVTISRDGRNDIVSVERKTSR